MENEQPIIVIKKKGGHGGHHGGAWKVAYADFVTAMMALFIVLWLMSSTSKQTQEEIAGYFNDPKGTSTKKGSENKPALKEAKDKQEMVALKNQLLKAIAEIDALNRLKKQIEINLTDEGLRIELVEDQKGTFFESGSAQPTPALVEILQVLATQLKDLPNSISIEGHTDAQAYVKQAAYGNWELSTDRANVARREMQANGIRLNQVSQVRGFADQQLHVPSKPLDPANRRVSLVVQNLPKAPAKKTTGSPDDQTLRAASDQEAKPPAEPGHDQPKPAVTEANAAAPAAMAVATPKPAPGLMQKVTGLFGRH